jgi:hypothetical protein
MSSRTAAWLAGALCLLSVTLLACSVVFAVLNHEDPWELTYLIGVFSCALVGGVVASRRPYNPVGWFLLGSAVSFTLQHFTGQYATYGLLTAPGSLPLARAMAWPQTFLYVPGVFLILCFLPLYFPDGRLLSPRWRPVLWIVVLVSVVVLVLAALTPGKVGDDTPIANPLGIEVLRPIVGLLDAVMLVLGPALIFVSAASLVVRFRRSTGEERRQMEWLTYAAAAMSVMLLVSNVLDASGGTLYGAVDLLTSLVFAGIPVAVGIAVLKHRLYDIDVLINRTLVYGPLTATLALVYVGGIVLLQRLLVILTGQESTLAVVASTLLIAALFNPLRRRIQGFVDRRFYRRKYDAAKILVAFGSRLRDETELDALSGDVVEVVREAMQPAHVSLWLRPDTASKGRPIE